MGCEQCTDQLCPACQAEQDDHERDEDMKRDYYGY